jgi:flagellar protein FliS
MAIITELQANLDFSSGTEIARSLDRLYRYMKDRILEANLRQDAEPMKETARLLGTLRDAWIEVARNEARRRTETAREARPKTGAPPLPVSAPAPPAMPLSNLNITA